MNTDKYLAVAYYDFSKNNENTDVNTYTDLLIVDVDLYSIGFCKHDNKGAVEKICEYSLPDAGECVKDINVGITQSLQHEVDIFDLLDDQVCEFNRLMKNYYRSEKMMNASFEELAGVSLDCAGFDDVFNVSRKKIDKLISSLNELWSSSGFDEAKTRIILFGKSSTLYPITYYIRSIFSFDPFLADDRFVNDSYSDRSDQIYEIGSKLYEESQRKMKEVFIYVYDGVGEQIVSQNLPIKEKRTDDDMEYFGPLFVSKGEELELENNSKKLKIPLHGMNEARDSCVIELGMRTVGEKLIACIRETEQPLNVYEYQIR